MSALWVLHFSDAPPKLSGYIARGFLPDVMHDITTTVDKREAHKFASREQAAAWVLAYLDAKIVDSIEDLSLLEPSVYIERLAS